MPVAHEDNAPSKKTTANALKYAPFFMLTCFLLPDRKCDLVRDRYKSPFHGQIEAREVFFFYNKVRLVDMGALNRKYLVQGFVYLALNHRPAQLPAGVRLKCAGIAAWGIGYLDFVGESKERAGLQGGDELSG
jgi:hypothetical protein